MNPDYLPACDCDDLSEANLRLRIELSTAYKDNLELRWQIRRLESEIEKSETEIKRLKANEKNRAHRAKTSLPA